MRLSVLAPLLFLSGFAKPARADFEYDYRPEWRRFGVWDYAGTAAVLGTYLTVELSLDGPRGADWDEPLPLDAPLFELFVAPTRAARERADKLSDVFWYGTVVYSAVVPALAPVVRGGNVDAAWQFTMMNIQAYSVASLLIRIPHKLIGRTRPLTRGCNADPDYSQQCGTRARFVSFFGGHYSVSMTGAGLACAHHLHGEIFGGGWPDTSACVAALSAGTLVGYYRLRAAKHWFSDQVVAFAVGMGSGFVLPSLLYYRPFWRQHPPRPRTTGGRPRVRAVALPLLSEDTLGLQLLVVN